jgi:hypothetical protein
MRVWQRTLDGGLVRILPAKNPAFGLGLHIIGGRRERIWLGGRRQPVVLGFTLVFVLNGATVELPGLSIALRRGITDYWRYLGFRDDPYDRIRDAIGYPKREGLDLYSDILDGIWTALAGHAQMSRRNRRDQRS